MKKNLKKILKFIKDNKLKIGIIFLILLVLTIIIKNVFFSTSLEPTKSNAFFISDSSGKYALFNNKGKKLTDFIYKEANDLFNNISIVETSDGKKGVINKNGKYIVKLGKYESIRQYSGLIKAVDKDDNNYLLDSDGKKLISKKNFTITTNSDVSLFAIVSMDKYYYIYNYLGDVIKKYKIEEDSEEIPNIDEQDGYAAISYNKETIIINTSNFKKIKIIKDDSRYCIYLINENKDTIILNSCKNWYENESKEIYKYLIGKKLYDAPKDCTKLYFDNNNLVCNKDNKNYLVIGKNKVAKDDLSSIAYQSPTKYLKQSKNDLIYVKNGKEKNKVSGYKLSDSNYNKNGIFLTYNIDKNNYAYMDVKGNLKFDKTYAFATSFDKNDFAKVYNKKDNYYLINKKGKKVSNTYTSIFYNNGYYIVAKDDKKGILNSKGKEIINPKYTTIEIKNINDKYYAYVHKNEEYTLIDLENKKEILTTKSGMIFKDSYINTVDNDKDIYYTYEGKLIYKVK